MTHFPLNWLRSLQTRFHALFRQRQLDAEMDEEMRSHIELRTQANIEAMNPEEARFAALRQFGWRESVKEEGRVQPELRHAFLSTLYVIQANWILRKSGPERDVLPAEPVLKPTARTETTPPAFGWRSGDPIGLVPPTRAPRPASRQEPGRKHRPSETNRLSTRAPKPAPPLRRHAIDRPRANLLPRRQMLNHGNADCTVKGPKTASQL